MKYTIEGYSQQIAIKLGLNIEDIIILRWIQDFQPLMVKKIIDNEEYIHINYLKLLEDLPILSFNSKRSLIRKLENFEKLQLLKRKCIKDKNGTHSYIKLTNKMSILISNKDFLDIIEDNITPTLDTPINNTKKEFKKPTLDEIKQYCEERNNDVNYKRFYDYYEANNWQDSNGKKIISWKQKLIACWENRDNKAKEEKRWDW